MNYAELIEQLRAGQKHDFGTGALQDMSNIMDEAADALEAAQLADDPVIWECKAGGLKRLSQKIYDNQSDAIKLWYSRIQAPQVTMTDDEIYQMYSEPCSDKEMIEFARAIEARHGIGVKS